MANFFVKPSDQFTVTIPFDVSNPEDPQIIFAAKLENYREALSNIPENCIEYHWMKFRKPDWGLDCYIRELSYVTVQSSGTGGGMGTAFGSPERILSQERFDEVRLRYLLVGSSFFSNEGAIGFLNLDGRSKLNDTSEQFIKSLDPVILRVFLSIASQVLDLGVPGKRLLSSEDYKRLRNEDGFIKKLLVEKGLVPKTAIVDESDPELKKKSETSVTEPSTLTVNPVTQAGTP